MTSLLLNNRLGPCIRTPARSSRSHPADILLQLQENAHRESIACDLRDNNDAPSRSAPGLGVPAADSSASYCWSASLLPVSGGCDQQQLLFGQVRQASTSSTAVVNDVACTPLRALEFSILHLADFEHVFVLQGYCFQGAAKWISHGPALQALPWSDVYCQGTFAMFGTLLVASGRIRATFQSSRPDCTSRNPPEQQQTRRGFAILSRDTRRVTMSRAVIGQCVLRMLFLC